MNYEDRLFLASLLGLILPGIGHLYLGFIRRGMIVLVIGFAITIGVSAGQSNYDYNDGLLFGLVLFISFIIWIAAGVWQIFDLRLTIKKRIPWRESKSLGEFKNLAILVIGIMTFKLVFLVIMEIGGVSIFGAAA